MSGVDSTEVLLLFLIALVVLGPARLPQIASKVGSWLGQARRMTRVMKRQLEEELDLENIPSKKPAATPNFPPKSAAAVEPAQPVSDDSERPVEHDDTYSPAHEEDDIGTGVGDEPDSNDDTVRSDDGSKRLDE